MQKKGSPIGTAFLLGVIASMLRTEVPSWLAVVRKPWTHLTKIYIIRDVVTER